MPRTLTKVAIVWPWLPAYRLKFVERSRQVLAREAIELHIVSGDAPPGMVARNDTRTDVWNTKIPTRWIRLGSKQLPIRPMTRFLREFDPDLLILEFAFRAAPAILEFKRASKPDARFGWWGHGVDYNTSHSTPVQNAKLWMARQGDWFFAYTQAGEDAVIASGFPSDRVRVFHNSIDTDELTAQLAATSPEAVLAFRRELGLKEGHTALFLGGVDAAKDIDYLMQSAREAHRMDADFRLLLAGGGDKLTEARRLQERGWPIIAMGRVEGQRKALALKATDVMMIPSVVGLVAIDALNAGHPVVTRGNNTHGPEIDYLPSGSLVKLEPDAPPREFATSTLALLNNDPERQAIRQANADVAQRFTLDNMVQSFTNGVMAWDEMRRAGN